MSKSITRKWKVGKKSEFPPKTIPVNLHIEDGINPEIVLEVCKVWPKVDGSQPLNAELIAEAGTVYNETGRGPREMQKQNDKLNEFCSSFEKVIDIQAKELIELKQQSDARLEALNRITSASDDLITWTMAHRPKNSPEHDNLYKELERSIKSSKKTINGEPSPTSQRVEDLEEALADLLREEVTNYSGTSCACCDDDSLEQNFPEIIEKARKTLSGKESRNQKLEDGISSSLETLRFIKSETDKEDIVMLHEINSRIGQLEALKSLDNE